jgi:phage terminase large subunit
MQINLLPHQWDAVNSTHENTGLIGGVGLGKTYCGSAWIMKKYEEDSLDLITANTYGQLINATLASVFKNLDQWGVPFDFNQQRKILTINKRKRFLCLSLDSYDQHRGIEVGNWWADEAAYNDYDAFLTMKGRLRDKGGKLQTLITTTPKGFNWVYDYFHPSGEKHDPKRYKLITASSFTNKHLPSGYLDSLKSEYDDKLVEQELMGLFVNLTAGKVYYAFSREDNLAEIQRQALPIYAALDFNVDPMTAVVFQVVNDSIHIFDEVFLRNSDTFQMSAELVKRGYAGISVIPDSTGGNRKTSGKSDHIILREAGFNLMPTFNPHVTDRVNNVNRLLVKKRMIISPKCVKLINDLEKVSWKGSDLDGTSDKLLTHISDCAGYAAWRLFPIKQDYTNVGPSSSRR